jgi:hypothetical protein
MSSHEILFSLSMELIPNLLRSQFLSTYISLILLNQNKQLICIDFAFNKNYLSIQTIPHHYNQDDQSEKNFST